MGIPAPPQERLEGEAAHSPPSDDSILQLIPIKQKTWEEKSISTPHDAEPLGVRVATGGGLLPSSNQSRRPCAALAILITNTA